jgi:hypothetical protein
MASTSLFFLAGENCSFIHSTKIPYPFIIHSIRNKVTRIHEIKKGEQTSPVLFSRKKRNGCNNEI